MAYYTCPGWLWWWWRIWWNEDWRRKPKYWEKPFPSATLSTTNPTWPDPGSNPGRRGGKPATNRLSYGAASSHTIVPVYVRYQVMTKRSPVFRFTINNKATLGISVWTNRLCNGLRWCHDVIKYLAQVHIILRREGILVWCFTNIGAKYLCETWKRSSSKVLIMETPR
jgi:hypothetical protein